MSFFSGDYFKEPFFKNSYFGKKFFNNKFFDETTLAHPLSSIVASGTEIGINCNRTITGIFDSTDFKVTINGNSTTCDSAVETGKDMVLTIIDVMVAEDIVKVSYLGSDINNFGIMEDYDVVNSLILSRRRKR